MSDREDRKPRSGGTPAESPLARTREESGEPSGEERAENEAAIDEATERPGIEEIAADLAEEQPESEEPAKPEEPEEPEDPLAAARNERDEYLALAQRAQADFENYKKRVAKDLAAAGERAKSGLVRELLPVVDNLERALASAEESEQHLAEGVRLVHSELVAVLQRSGVEPFDPRGEPFDPAVHEALSTRSEEGADAGLVLDVVEKGYKLNGTVLRPARVVVSG